MSEHKKMSLREWIDTIDLDALRPDFSIEIPGEETVTVSYSYFKQKDTHRFVLDLKPTQNNGIILNQFYAQDGIIWCRSLEEVAQALFDGKKTIDEIQGLPWILYSPIPKSRVE